jgi:hypothetical protein
MSVPTDDPAPRTRPRRATAEAEARLPASPGAAPAAGAASTGREPAVNGNVPEPESSARSPRPAPPPGGGDDERTVLDDLLGDDPRIDEFLTPAPERPPGRSRPAREGRRRKSGAVARVGATQASLVGPVVPDAVTAAETAFVAAPGRRARRVARRQRARRVHRLVRHVEPWSVLKLALVFYFCLWVILLVAGAILWRVAVSSGVIDNIEGFIESLLVLDNFKFNGDELFRAYAVGGLLMVLISTGFTVLAAVLFNLISDLIGGVRVTVIQEETARPNEPRP